MIIVVLIFGFLLFWLFLRIIDFYGWIKRQKGKKRQTELEINNSEENFIEIDSLTNEIQKRTIKKNPFCKICKNK